MNDQRQWNRQDAKSAKRGTETALRETSTGVRCAVASLRETRFRPRVLWLSWRLGGANPIGALLVLAALGLAVPAPVSAAPPAVFSADPSVYSALPAPGRKVAVGADHYFVYGFPQKPALGVAVLKIELFRNDGTRATDLQILGASDMPSMRGHHAAGDKPFRLSKRGDYLLPVDIVMPGDWEVLITVLQGDTVLLRGAYRFHV